MFLYLMLITNYTYIKKHNFIHSRSLFYIPAIYSHMSSLSLGVNAQVRRQIVVFSLTNQQN